MGAVRCLLSDSSLDEVAMTIEELRIQIDILDRRLVELLSERARAAQMIGCPF